MCVYVYNNNSLIYEAHEGVCSGVSYWVLQVFLFSISSACFSCVYAFPMDFRASLIGFT